MASAPGVCAQNSRAIALLSRNASPSLPLGFAAVAVVLLMGAGEFLHVRFSYTVAGAVLAALTLFSETLAWQTAITATYAAFSWDLLKSQKTELQPALWTLVIVTTFLVVCLVARYPRMRIMFLVLTWRGVANSFRDLLPPAGWGSQLVMVIVFVAFAILITIWHQCKATQRTAMVMPL
jgi:hypothetical protein